MVVFMRVLISCQSKQKLLMAPNATLVGPPDLKPHFLVANFNNHTATAKTTRISMRPSNLIPIKGLITTKTASSSDQIHYKDSSGSSFGNHNGTNPCLDLFFNVEKPPEYRVKKWKISELEAGWEASRKYVKQLLPLAWSHNPLTTLKLIMYLDARSLHLEFHTAACWLHHNHPKTLLCNLESFSKSFKSIYQLVDILYDLLEVQDERRVYRKADSSIWRKGTLGYSIWRKETLEVAQKAVERYERDPDYRLLHEQVSDLFVECLKSDIEKLKKQNATKDEYYDDDLSDDDLEFYLGEENSDDDDEDDDDKVKVTDAADCCLSKNPYEERKVQATWLCESIAGKIFPRESYPEEYKEANCMDRVCDRLKKEFLVPLKKYYNHRGWYSNTRTPKKYLKEVKAEKSKFAARALLPHEIIAFAKNPDFRQVAEIQWKAMVEDMMYLKNQGKRKDKGILNNCLAVCYNDGHVPVALAILMCELNEEPWEGKVINFSTSPKLHLIQGDDLRGKFEFVRRVDRDRKIDFQKVFDLILQVAVDGNLKPEQIIKKVFVFTSFMGFDDASESSWETDYEAIQNKFKEKGYENAVPHLVFWRLETGYDHTHIPKRPCTQPGVTILSGFSDNLVKLLLDSDGKIGPEFVMEAAISGEDYQKLVVVD